MKHKIKIFLKGIFGKFVLAFIIVGLMPVMGMSYIVFEKLPLEIEKYMVANYEETLSYASKSLELKITEFDQLTKSVYNFGSGDYSTLANVLKYQDYKSLPIERERVVENYLSNTLYSGNYIESVFLLDPEHKVFKYNSKIANFYYSQIEFDQYDKFEDIYRNSRMMTVLPSHHEDYFSKHDRNVLTFARNYFDVNYLPESEKIIATLLIDVNINFIRDIFERMKKKKKGHIYIVDTTGYNIYQSDNEGEYDSPLKFYREISERIETRKSGCILDDKQYAFFQKVENTDWLILYRVEQSNVMRMIDDLKTATTLLMMIIIVALVFSAIIFSNRLSKPIKNIIRQMKKVADGDLTTKVEIKASYEVNQLATAFNKMIERLNNYIMQAYVARIKQREAELNAIKTQIRPHYLYNTLEIIRMSALEENAENTQDMIVSLSEQLKYVIGQTGDRVKFGMEIDMIRHYFKIISIRFDNRITLEIDVPKELYQCKMLKLLIQPLVENAVMHGLKVKKGIGKVRLSAKADGNTLEIQVIDDGIGMNDETIHNITELLKSEKLGKEIDGAWENIGLKNVNDRVQMAYGNQYGLSMSSKENYGTLMTIKIPIELEVKSND